MNSLRLIMGDQLSHTLPTLHDYTEGDMIVMCEVMNEVRYANHHKKKLIFIFSAMRHFCQELKSKGYSVIYIPLDTLQKRTFLDEVRAVLSTHDFSKVVLTAPSEYRLYAECLQWQEQLEVIVEILEDNRFLSTPADFAQWAQGKKSLIMEYFYRMMRKKYHILMRGNTPEGGQWNYDKSNRVSPNTSLTPPVPTEFTPDTITRDVITMVERELPEHFGESAGFHFATSRSEALQVLHQFIAERLCLFGTYQDAMIQDEAWMYHGHIGMYLNIGLLTPLECIQQVEAAYHAQKVPIESAEGFIRQILGWREFIRGIYWYHMPEYKTQNYLQATATLPKMYWDGDTPMNCLKQCINETKSNAYAHHIQRLMVLGNFALLTGVAPKELNHWFLSVYIDAYEWVELPNVSGMVLFADGGFVATKPYASGGAYINRMSNYCKECPYNVKEKIGETACPFNYLYCHFLATHEEYFKSNNRLKIMYSNYHKMSTAQKQAITESSTKFLSTLFSH